MQTDKQVQKMIWLFHKVAPLETIPPPRLITGVGKTIRILKSLRRQLENFMGYTQQLPSQWWVTPEFFRKKMKEARSYDVVKLSNYQNHRNQLVITFDGVYENVYHNAFPILKEFGYPFELFVTGKYVGGNNAFDYIEPLANFANWDQVNIMEQNGGTLQYHSFSHPDLTQVELEHLKKEIAPPFSCNFFAYPYGKFNKEVLDLVKRYYRGALAVNIGDNSPYQLLRKGVCQRKRFLLL